MSQYFRICIFCFVLNSCASSSKSKSSSSPPPEDQVKNQQTDEIPDTKEHPPIPEHQDLKTSHITVIAKRSLEETILLHTQHWNHQIYSEALKHDITSLAQNLQAKNSNLTEQQIKKEIESIWFQQQLLKAPSSFPKATESNRMMISHIMQEKGICRETQSNGVTTEDKQAFFLVYSDFKVQADARNTSETLKKTVDCTITITLKPSQRWTATELFISPSFYLSQSLGATTKVNGYYQWINEDRVPLTELLYNEAADENKEELFKLSAYNLYDTSCQNEVTVTLHTSFQLQASPGSFAYINLNDFAGRITESTRFSNKPCL